MEVKSRLHRLIYEKGSFCFSKHTLIIFAQTFVHNADTHHKSSDEKLTGKDIASVALNGFAKIKEKNSAITKKHSKKVPLI